MAMRYMAILGLLAAALLSGCVEIKHLTPATFVQPAKGLPPGPPRIPRLLFVTPNVAPEAAGTTFAIEAVNLLPNSDAVVSFGTLTFSGRTNSTGTRIIDVSGNLFTAPPGTGVIDVEVFISGQNPPTLQLTNAFYYLPPGSPQLPTVTSMSPNTSDQFGGGVTIFQGTNVPLASGYQIVVSFLFSRGNVNTVAIQTASDSWSCPIPAVPAAENFTAGSIDVSVVVNFSSGGLPIPIIVAPPTNPSDGNPFKYTINTNPPDPEPQEFVIASGLFSNTAGTIQETFIRSVSLYDKAKDELRTLPEPRLADKYMQNGANFFAPAGTHYYPSPLMNGGVSYRDANSRFAHFSVPQFNRRYTPAPTPANPQPNFVTKPVTGRLFHCTGPESASAPTGVGDAFFAAYSNGEVEYFEPGLGAQIWEEIHFHDQFQQFPFFAATYDLAVPRVYVSRMDGLPFVASGRNTNEINCSGVSGRIQGLSLRLAGQYIYFTTNDGNVWRSPIDSSSSGINPIAQICSWPATGSHTVVSDHLSISGDGTTICFIAGTGIDRWDSFAASNTPPSTQDVYVIRNGHQGSANIAAVTNFAATTAGARQLVFWNLDDNAASTYGSMNVDNGANDRRVYMAGVNNNTGSNRPGSDVVVNFTGTLCAFVARENRAAADPPNSDAVVNYLYVARTDTTNEMLRVNAATTNNFGIGAQFDRSMAIVPGFWFPRKIPNAGMDRRIVFTCSGQAGGVQGAEQHLFTLDVNFSGIGVSAGPLVNRSDDRLAPPYNVGPAQRLNNYFGAFPSLSGSVLFLIEERSGELVYLDLRDGVSTLVQNVRRSHDQSFVILPNDTTASSPFQNTYLPSGFAADGSGSGLEHWGNNLRSLQGPGLNPFVAEYLFFVAQEAPGIDDLYVLQMSGLASPLPSDAINVTNLSDPGTIKAVIPAKDGGVIAVIKGPFGYPHGYRVSSSVDGRLYIVSDVPGTLAANATALTKSAVHVTTTGTKFSRLMDWYHSTDRYSLYFGEGTAVQPAPTQSQAFLRFSRLSVDRTNNNAIQPLEQVTPGRTALTDGAVVVYAAGKRE